MVLRFSELAMQHRMEAIGEIIMEQGYPTILCLQVSQSLGNFQAMCARKPKAALV